ncbi:DUF3617 family protein [Roseateles sp.]|uniref:DUF3617 domain-containing protein n=1 Tax=Roseateles sp. TaxID=1971397 RepID=UPI003265A2E6
MHHSRSIRPGALLAALSLAAGACGAAPVIQVNPGLWAADSEIWINGQSMKPGLQALRAKVRSGLSDEQKAEMDRRQAAEKQSCLTPAQSRIDLSAYLEKSLSDTGGPWKCEVNASKLDATAAAGSYACRTGGGGLTQGKFSATYGPTSYRFELNGRGNAVDGRTGNAISATEMDQRMLATGRWLGGSCS